MLVLTQPNFLFDYQMLSSLHVEKLVIPAIPDLVETWTKSFSFKPLESALKDEIKNLSLVVFAETTMLEKPICSAAAAQEEGIFHALPCFFIQNHVYIY